MKSLKKIGLIYILITVSIIMSSCGNKTVTKEKFTNVVESFGYTTTSENENKIEAQKGISSIVFHQYESQDEVDNEMKMSREMINAVCGTDFKYISYGEQCFGAEGETMFTLTASKGNTMVICLTNQSSKNEVIEILKKLGYIK